MLCAGGCQNGWARFNCWNLGDIQLPGKVREVELCIEFCPGRMEQFMVQYMLEDVILNQVSNQPDDMRCLTGAKLHWLC